MQDRRQLMQRGLAALHGGKLFLEAAALALPPAAGTPYGAAPLLLLLLKVVVVWLVLRTAAPAG